jgi:alpha-1,2-mannosyltransferase
MYTSALALSYAFYPSRSAALFPSNAATAPTPKYRTGLATGFFALGALLGWPFALALALPFVFEELFLASGQLVSAARLTEFRSARLMNWLRCVAAAGAIALPIVAIDSLAYGRTVIGTLNIFIYNVLSSRRGAGPELYGVEPWHFYLQNLMLNFGPAFVLAMLSLPAVALTLRFDRKRLALLPLAEEELKKKKGEEQLVGSTYTTLLLVRLAPLYLWLGILTLQPHKEERFVYPAYPLICFNAAVTIYLFRGLVERAFVKRTKSPYQVSAATRCVVVSHH